jgi:hypothetical protein
MSLQYRVLHTQREKIYFFCRAVRIGGQGMLAVGLDSNFGLQLSCGVDENVRLAPLARFLRYS